MTGYPARRAFSRSKVLVCVCGGVATYKAAEVVSQLVQSGAEVRVAMTPEATRFVAPLTFEAVSGNPVAADLLGPQAGAGRGGEMHIALSDWPDAILVLPATANTLARLAAGLADELVSVTILASSAPLVLAPAMHSRMWAQSATSDNVARLRSRGAIVVGPAEGRLASGEVGPGRLADTVDILQALAGALPGRRDMDGLRVVVTAGGTREAIDPVRYLGNRSSGRMGHALANAAAARGAQVVLVTTAEIDSLPGVVVARVENAREMEDVLVRETPGAGILLMAAAVADFRPTQTYPVKVPKADAPGSLELTRNPDLLALMHDLAPTTFRVGFAAETHELEAHALAKLAAKKVDMIVANNVAEAGIGMGTEDNAVTLFTTEGTPVVVGRAPKAEIAESILDHVMGSIQSRQSGKLVL
ncbi:MAG: bifunctional phosphopantothenoylcysteine decarboxylase/phosphopantothenate--cysteine ligase CoaBC [Candidatus Dormibacteria bacterium]